MTEFRWRRATRGYEWIPNDEEADEFGGEPSLRSVLEPIEFAFTEYSPFEVPELFQLFAHLDPTPEATLKFANEYGHLGTHFSETEEELEPGDDIETPQQRRGWEREVYLDRITWDSFQHWKRGIERMKEGVEYWGKIEAQTESSEVRQELLALINEELARHKVEVRIGLSSQLPSGFRMSYVPRNLLGAMWVQFAQSLADNTGFRMCKACDKWFPIGPDTNRTSRFYCSEACKSKAYRRRKYQAQRMTKAGKSIEEIADALDVKVKQVEK